MSWQILNSEPAYGVCDQCKKHDCGIIEGEHHWILTSIYDKSGDAIVIGFKCVELWAANLGISKEVIEKDVFLPPTDEQIADYVRKALTAISDSESDGTTQNEDQPSDHVNLGSGNIITKDELIEKIKIMDLTELKDHLSKKEIAFSPRWGEEKLRNEALKHV